MKRTNHSARHTTRAFGAAGLAMLALATVACSKKDETVTPTPQVMPRVAITSVKGDVTSQLMAAIYARVLENNGVRITRKDPVDMDRATYFQALQDDQFDMIPELSRDLLRFVLENVESGTSTTVSTATTQPAPGTTRPPIAVTTTTIAATTTTAATTDTGATSTSSADTTTTGAATTTTTAESTTTSSADTTTTTIPPTNEKSSIAQLFAINQTIPTTLIAYSGSLAEHTQVVACTNEAMAAVSGFQLFNLTDLASLAPQLRLGASAAWQADDVEGLALMQLVYAPEFADIVTVEEADLATAITDGKADCFVMDSLDPLITANDLTLLVDDQFMLAANEVIVLMSSTVNSPEVTSALDTLAGMLTTDKLNQMLREIVVNGTDIAVVANAFADNL